MNLKIIFFSIILILAFISTFATLSNGALFKQSGGRDSIITNIINFLYYIALITITVMSIIRFGWLYLIIIPLTSIISSWLFAYALKATILNK